MALTNGTISVNVEGNKRVVRLTTTFDSSYATGGEAFDPYAVGGFVTVDRVIVEPKAGYTFDYVPSTTPGSRKIKAYWVDTSVDGAALAEVASTTNLSTVVADVTIIGN